MILSNFWFTTMISFERRLLVAVRVSTVAQSTVVVVARLIMAYTVSCWIYWWRSSMVALLAE